MNQSFTKFYACVMSCTFVLFSLTGVLFAQTNFVKHTGNPILPLGNAGEWDDTEAAYAHVLNDGSTYHMWYSGAPQLQLYRIGYATSSDGINWTKHASNSPALGAGTSGAFDDAGAWLPWVLFDGSTFEMWYSGNFGLGGIGYITSSDPAVWTRQRTNPVLTGGGASAWDEGVWGPVVLHKDSLYQMWYNGRSQNNIWQTGYATSPDGIIWSKHTNNPVLTVGAASEWDAVAVLPGSVIYENGLYHMWYHGTSGDPFSDWKIGYATSPDGINWTKHSGNPIMSGDPLGWDANQTGFPRVIKDGHRFRMWYQGKGASGVDRLGYAEDNITDIETVNNVQPTQIHLQQNYPNPFNPATTIEFAISISEFVSLKIFNLQGQEVANLVSEKLGVGKYEYNWNAGSLASGVYVYRLEAGEFLRQKKMLLIK